MIKTTPMIIARYIGWFPANTPRAIATIPINKTSIEVKFEILPVLDNNALIPNMIIMNPTIKNW